MVSNAKRIVRLTLEIGFQERAHATQKAKQITTECAKKVRSWGCVFATPKLHQSPLKQFVRFTHRKTRVCVMERVLLHIEGELEYADDPANVANYSPATHTRTKNARKILMQYYNDLFKYLVQRSQR
jgi:hypothetical protein